MWTRGFTRNVGQAAPVVHGYRTRCFFPSACYIFDIKGKTFEDFAGKSGGEKAAADGAGVEGRGTELVAVPCPIPGPPFAI